MLKTIKIPKNLKYLSETLPEPNYEPPRVLTLEKALFLKTISNRKTTANFDQKSSSLPKMNPILSEKSLSRIQRQKKEKIPAAIFNSEKSTLKKVKEMIGGRPVGHRKKVNSRVRGLEMYSDNQILLQKYMDRKMRSKRINKSNHPRKKQPSISKRIV